MKHTDTKFITAVEETVRELESKTDAEVVVVVAGRSGSYRDVALQAGLVLGALVLGVVVYAPWNFSAAWLPLDLAVAIGLGAFVTSRASAVLRLLTTTARRRRQVTFAAAAEFHLEQVHATRGRTGLLVYASVLERVVEIVPDHGIDARIPRGEWNEIRFDIQTMDGLLLGLRECGAVLARHIPPLADNPDEVPNAPRIRP